MGGIHLDAYQRQRDRRISHWNLWIEDAPKCCLYLPSSRPQLEDLQGAINLEAVFYRYFDGIPSAAV